MLKKEITKKDVMLSGSVALAYCLLHLVGWRLFGEIALISASGIIVMLLLFGMILVYRSHLRIQEHIANLEKNVRKAQGKYASRVETLLSLYAILQPTAPFPNTGGVTDMAAYPDFLKKIMEMIYQKRPQLIVEASCGLSTLVSAYCLKNLGGTGRVIALEHEAKYAALTQELIALHGLQDIAAVIHAPLTETEIQGKTWQWYDLSQVHFDAPIDMLFVDGPPGKLQKLSRYPALPMFLKNLHEQAIIFLDDGNRPDEKEIVVLWSNEFTGFQAEYIPLERGAYLLRRQGGA